MVQRRDTTQTKTTRGRRAADFRRILNELESAGVHIVDRAGVRLYLQHNPDLAKLLPPIGTTARQEFGTDAELALELYRDPEIDDRYLTLYVRWPQYPASAVEGISRVSERFAKKLARVSGHLLMTTDFRSPRGIDVVQLEGLSGLGPHARATGREERAS